MKTLLYFSPAVISLLFYGFLAAVSGFNALHPAVWLFVGLLFLAALLMQKRLWWGFLGGILTGGALIFMGMQETGQIFSETPIGIAFCLYYLLCGLLACRDSRKNGRDF